MLRERVMGLAVRNRSEQVNPTTVSQLQGRHQMAVAFHLSTRTGNYAGSLASTGKDNFSRTWKESLQSWPTISLHPEGV